MSELDSAAVIAALGNNLGGVLGAINTEAAIGALFGALVYFSTTQELPMWNRLTFFFTSFVMGYLFTPAVVDVEFQGMRPFAYPGPAGFACAGLVVTILLAAIRQRGGTAQGAGGGKDD